jgi:hypothetical protein
MNNLRSIATSYPDTMAFIESRPRLQTVIIQMLILGTDGVTKQGNAESLE